MRLLLDTCIVYDWMMGKFQDTSSISLIQTKGALVSAISVWEMAIKHALGKLPLPTTNIADEIEAQGFQLLNITAFHAQMVLNLDHHHKDPFDRLLIAQAKNEVLRIVTYDTVFQKYTDEILLLTR